MIQYRYTAQKFLRHKGLCETEVWEAVSGRSMARKLDQKIAATAMLIGFYVAAWFNHRLREH